MYLFKMRIPVYAEHGILVRQLSQCFEHRMDIVLVRQHRIGEDRRNDGRIARGLRAQGVPWANVRKTRHGADATSGNFPGKLVFLAVIDAHLVDLLLPCLGTGTSVNHLLGMQRAAGHFNPSQALATIPAADTIDARGKLRKPCLFTHQRAYAVQQLVHALVLERRAGKTGKELALGNHARQRRDGKLTRLEKLVERHLV